MRWSTLLFVLLLANLAWAQPLRLGNVAEGQAVLGRADEFTEQLSPFDRAARLKTAVAVDEQRYLQFAQGQVQEWSGPERTKLEAAIASLESKLNKLRLPPVGEVLLVKSTGKEEGGAAYTRGNAIILAKLPEGGSLQRLLAHEFFHVLSRRHPELRDRLYALAGFEPCPTLIFPAQFVNRKITNPDAPISRHCIHLGKDQATYIPILYSKVEKYDEKKGGQFFDSMEFRLLQVTVQGQETRPVKGLILLDPRKTPEYFKKTGENTHYFIHPEEVIAENFVLLVEGGKVANPKLVDSLKQALQTP